MFGTTILIIEIICMLPNIKAQQRNHIVSYRIIAILATEHH